VSAGPLSSFILAGANYTRAALQQACPLWLAMLEKDLEHVGSSFPFFDISRLLP